MILPAISDWDDAYANRTHIPNAESFVERWQAAAADFRQQNTQASLDVPYGASDDAHSERHLYDLFPPASGQSRGLFVFVHGGYWLAFDKNTWSHFAAGAQALGYTVMLPSYPLCPDASIAEIQRSVAASVEQAAGSVPGPIVLSGHSAGGHLVTSLLSTTKALSNDVRARIAHVLSISGVHDLRPLLNTTMNEQLQLSVGSAADASPALAIPALPCQVTAWVGGNERAEFLRQNALIANVWRGLGSSTAEVIEPDRHHFNVIDGLLSADSPMLRHTLGALN